MVRQTTKVIIFEIFGVVSLLLMAAVAIVAIRLASGPFELGMFRDDVEAALTQARGGRDVDVEKLTLQWSPSERRIFLVARNVSMDDADGNVAVRAKRANITLDAGAILLGDIVLLKVDMSDGTLDIKNTAPNVWSVGGQPLPPIPEEQLPQTPEEWLARTNSVLGAVLGGLRDAHGTQTFESLTFTGMTLRFLDMDDVEVGRVDAADGNMQRLEQDVALELSGRGEGIGLPGEFAATLATSEGYGGLEAEISVLNWPLADLARRFRLPGFETGGLTADISFGAVVEREAGLIEVDLTFDQQEGALILPVQEEVLQDIDFELGYIIADDAVNINALSLTTTRADIEMTGRLSNVLAQNALRRIDADFSRFDLDVTPTFPTRWAFRNVDLSADLSDDFSIAVIRRLTVPMTRGVTLRASGEVDVRVPHETGELPFTMDMAAEIEGDLSKDLVLNYWPERLGAGARRFVVNRLEDGLVNELRSTVSLKPDSLAEGYLRDEDLNVEFGFQNGHVYFLRDLPPVENAVGTAKLGGNSFSVSVVSATYDDWEITQGSVDFAAFMPRGQDLIVQAEGQGPAVSILRHLSESRLQLQERTGFDPERVSGQATSEFYMRRPALSDVPFEDIFLRVNGTIVDAGLKDVAWGMDLADGTVQVDLTQDRLILTGFGDVGPAPAQFTWRDGLTNDGLPSDISASGILTPDILNSLGVTGRAYLSGEIPVELQGKVDNGSLDVATLGFDLREARIDVSEIGWVKPAGDAARATLIYTGGDTAQASTLRVESDTAALDGDLLLDTVGRFQALTLRRLFIDGTAEVAGRIERIGRTGLDVELTGAFLDVSSVLSDIGGLGGSGGDIGINLNMSANVDRLRLRRGLDLSDASVTVESDESGIRGVSANGEISGGAKLAANYLVSDDGGAPRLNVTADDAGFLAEAVLGIEFIRGGRLQLEGTVGTGGDPTRLLANVSDVQLINAPVFTQILSLASLRGLADTLSGDGVLFSNVVAPISIGGGRYVIDGGRASGPALGLTANGWVATDGSGIDLNGVLVPSFGVNSVLGGVPIIGDLVVGRQGEGIFSINYAVNGSLERAQVAVNPLSAVTPGILRRIFENPADTSIPDSLDVDPNLKPPQPKLPDFGEEEYIEPAPGAG
ncbi:MAG: AsmA-like C-terminal region-containing protein [Henriciella sp.]|nr:AsmA-like C-terminal region-containing protein [Henriciella sp.]